MKRDLTRKGIKICDTTLRDGEQSAGVVFANEEKIRIAKLLDEIGVDQIEVGIPVMGGDEKEAITKIVQKNLSASILSWNRADLKDIEHSIECGVDAAAISISTSDIHIQYKLKKDRDWVLKQIDKCVRFAKSKNLYVSANAEDASRTSMEFLLKWAGVAKSAGADRIRFCDTLGLLNPHQIYDKIKMLIDEMGIDVEMHTHNDFGMATANTIAGITAGAVWANTTVNGLGERTGNASLEEVIMALKYTCAIDLGYQTKRFREIAEYVARASGREIPHWKPIVGNNVFAHEAGVHVDGVYKDPRNYEIFSPEEVGMQRRIIIGKHSGTSTIKMVLKERNIETTDEEAYQILEKVRKSAVSLKRSLTENEVYYIWQDMQAERATNESNPG